ncbi:DNA recombination protein RmuC [bacterium]
MYIYIILGFLSGALISFLILKKNSNLKDKENLELNKNISAKDQIIINLNEKLEDAKKNTEILTDKFENIATKILKNKSNEFTDLNKTNLGSIVDPLKEQLKDFKQKVEYLYDSENKERSSLKTELKNLMEFNKKVSDDANNLATALKGEVKTQGSWGEMQLERLLESVGLQKGIHYEMQKNFVNENNDRIQPDCIIHMPDDKHLIIDSKVSLVAYEKYFNSKKSEDKKKSLKEHLDSIYSHIDNLSKKNYQHIYDIKQPDFVLMFFPIESALALASNEDLTIYEKALNKNIILTPGSTLISTLRTISYIWKQEYQKQNVVEIARIGGSLYDKMVAFTEDIHNIQKSLNLATESCDKALNKLSTSTRKGNTIIGKAEQLRLLGAKVKKKFSNNLLTEE